MSLTDPIGDMLTRIRNAQLRRRDTVVKNPDRYLKKEGDAK